MAIKWFWCLFWWSVYIPPMQGINRRRWKKYIHELFYGVFWWRKCKKCVHSWPQIDLTSFWWLIWLHSSLILHSNSLLAKHIRPLEYPNWPIRIYCLTKPCKCGVIMLSSEWAPVCVLQWFWEVVHSLTQEERVLLLQFVTGRFVCWFQ